MPSRRRPTSGSAVPSTQCASALFGLERHGALDVAHAFGELPLVPAQHLADRDHRVGEFRVALQRPLGGGLRPRIRVVGRHPVVGEVAPHVGDAGVGTREARVLQQRVLEQVERLAQPDLGELVEVKAALQVRRVRVEALGRRAPRRPRRRPAAASARRRSSARSRPGRRRCPRAAGRRSPTRAGSRSRRSRAARRCGFGCRPCARCLRAASSRRASRRSARASTSLRPLNANDDERDATWMPGTLESALMISSVMPSLKYSFSGSALMLASGSTAIAVSPPFLLRAAELGLERLAERAERRALAILGPAVEVGGVHGAEIDRQARAVEAHRHQHAAIGRVARLAAHPARIHGRGVQTTSRVRGRVEFLGDQGIEFLAGRDRRVPPDGPAFGLERGDERATRVLSCRE